jgi:hypothetical protein
VVADTHQDFVASPLGRRIIVAARREGRRWHRWLVNDFARRDLGEATEADLEDLHSHICALAQVGNILDWELAATRLSRHALLKLQSSVRRGIALLIGTHRWVVEAERTVSLVVDLDHASGRTKHGAPTTYYLGRPDSPRMPMTVLYEDAPGLTLERRFLRRAAETLAPQVEARLRRCHWCAEIFARRGRRDLFCSKQCAQKDRDNRKLPKGRRSVPPFVDRVERVESSPYAQRRRAVASTP